MLGSFCGVGAVCAAAPAASASTGIDTNSRARNLQYFTKPPGAKPVLAMVSGSVIGDELQCKISSLASFRRPMNADEIRTVAVLGAGTMGNGIAHVFARSGYTVI